jgi:hypothetical protein
MSVGSTLTALKNHGKEATGGSDVKIGTAD